MQETIDKLEFNCTDAGVPHVVAYSAGKSLWVHKLTDMNDLFSWCQKTNSMNAKIIVPDTSKKNIPKKPDFGDELPQNDAKDLWIPFAQQIDKMPRRKELWPSFLIIHWTSGDPNQTGKDGIEAGAKNGFTYLFLDKQGRLWQGAPTNQGGYHIGKANIDSFDCLGVEVACAGKVEKIGNFYVPWFAKKSDGSIDEKRCIPESEIVWDDDDQRDDGSFKGYYHIFTEEQVNTLIKLALYCIKHLKISPDKILGHDEVALPVGRKVDPGASLYFEISPGVYKFGMVAFRNYIKKLSQ